MNKVFIIAEAGANHNRDFNLALQLIDVAIEAKVSAVKFQTYSSKTLYAKNTPNFAGYENINKLIEDIELPRSWQADLKLYCDDNGVEFMSTPFDRRAVDELYDLGVKRYKIAGFEATDPRLVKHVASTGLPIIISAGIGVDLVAVQNIIDWVSEQNQNPDLTFLHCNNAYPTPFEDICLGQIEKIKKTKYSCPIKVGLSDHTLGILVPPVAVGLGAETIEKHYTLDRTLPGPDHSFAIEPGELLQMVENIRIIEKCLNEKVGFTDSEKSFTKAMRSVVSKQRIIKGESITLQNLTTKRPSMPDSIPAREYYNLINQGMIATRDIEEDSILCWEDVRSEKC
jgi:N,N'-diacetyllegionaminate synthase